MASGLTAQPSDSAAEKAFPMLDLWYSYRLHFHLTRWSLLEVRMPPSYPRYDPMPKYVARNHTLPIEHSCSLLKSPRWMSRIVMHAVFSALDCPKPRRR